MKLTIMKMSDTLFNVMRQDYNEETPAVQVGNTFENEHDARTFALGVCAGMALQRELTQTATVTLKVHNWLADA